MLQSFCSRGAGDVEDSWLAPSLARSIVCASFHSSLRCPIFLHTQLGFQTL